MARAVAADPLVGLRHVTAGCDRASDGALATARADAAEAEAGVACLAMEEVQVGLRALAHRRARV